MILEPDVLLSYRNQMATAIEDGELETALELTSHLSDGRIAQILKDSEDKSALEYLEAVPGRRAGTILSILPAELTAEWLEELSPERAASLIGKMPDDSAADLLQELPESFTEKVLDELEPEFRRVVNELRVYERESVGAYMHTHFLAVPKGTTIEGTLEAIHDAPGEIENRSYVYVVNNEGSLVGVVSIKDLIRSEPASSIDLLMNTEVVAVHPDAPVVESSQLLRNRRLQMLPVVEQERLVGVLLLDDAIQILSKNLVDQFVHIGAASEDESFYTPPLGSVKKRLPWMAGNVFLNLGAVAVISSFEGTIEAVAALAVFLPMITDMGGNVGIQALSVSIRSIALGEVRLNDYWRASKKEIVVGLINGLALGLLFAVLAYILRGSPVLGLVAGTALAVNVFVAGIVGGTLPFLIKRMGYDPAMMTGPVLTTITDITGVTIYLGLSTILLSSLLAG